MCHRPIRVGALLVTTIILSGLLRGNAGSAQAQDTGLPPDTVAGEKLDPSMLGPGVIESMEEAIKRVQANPPAPAADPDGGDRDHGDWWIPVRNAIYFPHSGTRNVINKWGDTRMGIGFPGLVDVTGAYFAGQAAEGAWTTGVQVTGYRKGEKVATTDWFHEIGRTPVWFAMDLHNVDRIEIQSIGVFNGGGWYGMDDLTYVRKDNAADPDAKPIVIDFEDTKYNQTLTGSNYAGLIWEKGQGDFDAANAVIGPARRLAEDIIPAPPEEGGIAGGGGSPPTLDLNFQGVIRGELGQFSFPPDTCGAIGPNHFLEVVNTNFKVINRTNGATIQQLTLGGFQPGSNGDSRVLYDQYSGRWIVIGSDFNTKIYLAVSLTNNAAGSWFKTSFTASLGSDLGFFPDYPTLGVDANGIYISATLQNLTIFAIDKAPLIGGTPSLGTVTAFRNLAYDGAIQCVHTYGTPSPAGEYCISRNGASATSLRLRRVNPPLTAPTLTTLTSVTVPNNASPPNAPVLGSSIPLDTIDARLMSAVFRDGFIWTTHTVAVSGRAACRWYKVVGNTSALSQSGTVDDPSLYYFDPSISVNINGDVVMGFSGSKSSQFASAYYTGRASTDPAGQMAPPAVLKAGLASHNLIDGAGRNRWGDYSHTTLDPNDETSLWTIQEYAHTHDGANNDRWGTWIGKVSVIPVPSNDDCANASVASAGSHPFTTVGATTDGPDEPAACNFGGSSQITNDIWFLYPAQCNGTATVSLCGSAYNSKLAVYGSTCPASSGLTIACNDAFCGDDAQVSFPVTSGQIFRIRVGGFNGATGTGTMVISCVPSAATGACCLTNGSCLGGVTQSSCQTSGGTYEGDNSLCADIQCPQPIGACCLASGACQSNVTQLNCQASGGAYQGDNTSCANVQCPQPIGACCMPNGTCQGNVTQANCQASGGNYQGNNTNCANVQCPQPVGSCCMTNGTCQDNLTQANCQASGGTYQGDDTNCANVQCPQPTGACCLPSGACQGGVTQANCTASSGTYQGDNTLCANVQCPQPCPGDVTGNGTVNVDDLLAVINGWGACPQSCPPYCSGDVNHTCAVNVDDLLAVINGWGPCP